MAPGFQYGHQSPARCKCYTHRAVSCFHITINLCWTKINTSYWCWKTYNCMMDTLVVFYLQFSIWYCSCIQTHHNLMRNALLLHQNATQGIRKHWITLNHWQTCDTYYGAACKEAEICMFWTLCCKLVPSVRVNIRHAGSFEKWKLSVVLKYIVFSSSINKEVKQKKKRERCTPCSCKESGACHPPSLSLSCFIPVSSLLSLFTTTRSVTPLSFFFGEGGQRLVGYV